MRHRRLKGWNNNGIKYPFCWECYRNNNNYYYYTITDPITFIRIHHIWLTYYFIVLDTETDKIICHGVFKLKDRLICPMVQEDANIKFCVWNYQKTLNILLSRLRYLKVWNALATWYNFLMIQHIFTSQVMDYKSSVIQFNKFRLLILFLFLRKTTLILETVCLHSYQKNYIE